MPIRWRKSGERSKMGKKEEKTNAVRALEQKKIRFVLHEYESKQAMSGAEVAAILKQDPATVFKTLVTVGRTGEHYVFLVPVQEELDLKRAAGAVGEKKIEMVRSADLLGLTGYVHGGCSPIGMKRFFKTTVDASAEQCSAIFFSGGRFGLQVEISLEELRKMIPFELKPLTSEAKGTSSF